MAGRIEDYAVLGDLHTAALVCRDGSIDWLCLPRFDSPACFAALVDTPEAGHWTLAPAAGGPSSRRSYRGDTLVLDSEWDTDDGTVRITEFMPVRSDQADVVRVVEGITGRVRMRSELRLRFDYGSVTPWVKHDGGMMSVEPEAALERTERFWTQWMEQCTYDGEWPEAVRRSLITLKALTYAPTGGIVAAATTSLPETLGGSRNWDYRYCWLRDATFTLQALLKSGFVDEARAWREWLLRAVAGDPADLKIMYGVDGTRRLPEYELPWLAGYESSPPVRIGNGAADQFQLDVWGEVLDGLHVARERGLAGSVDAWDLQRALMDFLEGAWEEPDNGLWEVRGPRRHFVHSKVMAWAGADRMVQAVEHFGLEGPVDRWRALRERIHDDVCARGYDADRGTFTQYYGGSELDAALLLIPRVGFLPYSDERVRGTVRAVEQDLLDDGFLLRYRTEAGVDGLEGKEGAFLACSLWLVNALHGVGRTADARSLFERLLSLRNDLGLLAEEWDPRYQRQVGNFPQAFSHEPLVVCAAELSSGNQPTTQHAERWAGTA